jgi:dihydroflavonol-4-reductase
MKLFLTGVTGFIGKHLINRLARTDHEIHCLVRKDSQIEQLSKQPNIIYHVGNVLDPVSLDWGMKGCDCVFHLANLYSMWLPDPGLFSKINIEGTENVMACALSAGVKKMVYLSTAAVYGTPKNVPFTEESIPGSELYSHYAVSKSRADEIAWKYFKENQLPLVTLYPGIVIGAGDNKPSGQYIRDLVYRRVPSTIFHHSVATYVYVGDVVEAVIRAAENPMAVGQKYLIGNEQLSGAQFANMISEISEIPLPFFQLPDFVVIPASYLFTGLSAITRQYPKWGLSVDAAWTLKHGFVFDGSKAERELGLIYHPIRSALEEAITSYLQAN